MKFTNKWIVVPYNSFNSLPRKNENKLINIFLNKSLTNEEKLAKYNNYIFRKLNKSKENNSDTKNLKSEDISKENNNYEIEEDILSDEEFSGDDSELNTPIKQEKSEINTPQSIQHQKLEKIYNENNKKEKRKFNQSLLDMSLFNLPAAQNTRNNRKISNETFQKILSANDKKRKRNTNNSIGRNPKVLIVDKKSKSKKEENNDQAIDKNEKINGWKTYKGNTTMDID